MAAPRAHDQGAALDPARRPAGRARARLDARGDARARPVPVPDGLRDRVPAQPARTRPAARFGCRAGSPWPSCFLVFAAAVAFVALALGSVVVDQTRSAADRIDDYVTTEDATGQDRRGPRHRSAAGVARRSRARADPDPEAGERLGRQPRRRRALEGDDGRDLVRAGRSVLDRRDALQPRPDRRDRDLHAARHAAARNVPSTGGFLRATVRR